jgi:hypothetical protein
VENNRAPGREIPRPSARKKVGQLIAAETSRAPQYGLRVLGIVANYERGKYDRLRE